jgi:hypothetical protein
MGGQWRCDTLVRDSIELRSGIFHGFRGGVWAEKLREFGNNRGRGQSVRKMCGRWWWHDTDRTTHKKNFRDFEEAFATEELRESGLER